MSPNRGIKWSNPFAGGPYWETVLNGNGGPGRNEGGCARAARLPSFLFRGEKRTCSERERRPRGETQGATVHTSYGGMAEARGARVHVLAKSVVIASACGE